VAVERAEGGGADEGRAGKPGQDGAGQPMERNAPMVVFDRRPPSASIGGSSPSATATARSGWCPPIENGDRT